MKLPCAPWTCSDGGYLELSASVSCRRPRRWAHTMELAQTPPFLELGWRDALPVILDVAVPTAMIDDDGQLGGASIECVCEETADDAVEGGDGGSRPDLVDDVRGQFSDGGGHGLLFMFMLACVVCLFVCLLQR